MAFTRTWDGTYEGVPTDANFMYEVDDYIRQCRTDIRERMDIDHYFDISGINADHGLHRRICFHSQITKPTAVADRGFLYIKDVAGKAELHWEDEDGNEIALTSGGVLSNTALAVLKSAYDANTILAANLDDLPLALTIAEQSIVGRKTGGNIIGLTGAEVLAILNTTASRILGQGGVGVTAALTGAEIRAILATAPFVVGSDADGDIWYRASGALARLAKGTALQLLRMNAGATAPEWNSLPPTEATGTIPVHFDGGISETVSAAYAKVKEVYIPIPGTFAVTFQHKSEIEGTSIYTKIYKNGVAAGTERTTSSVAWTSPASEDIVCASAGDLIQIYAKGSDSKIAYVKDLTLKGNVAFNICSNLIAGT